MNKITVQQAAEKWGVTPRRIQSLCKDGKIPGAVQWGRTWMIPADARYPYAMYADTGMPMPRKSPFLAMTDLYQIPGTVDQSIALLSNNPEAQILFAAEMAYHRGEIDQVYQYVQYILTHHTGRFAVLSGGMLLALCAVWNGDPDLWKKARVHITQTPGKTQLDQDVIALSLAAVDSSLHITDGFPEWFCHGDFERLPQDAQPAAWVYYVRHLHVPAHDVAMGRIKLDGVQKLGLMKTIPYIASPLISYASAERLILVEIYLRLSCAIAYQLTGDIQLASEQLDRAIRLALPDRLYGPFVENRRHIGLLLDERLLLADPEAAKKVKELHKQYHTGWISLHNAVLQRTVSVKLSPREQEIARLVAYGLTNAEIGSQLSISEHSVKSLVAAIRNKTGAEHRADLGAFI